MIASGHDNSEAGDKPASVNDRIGCQGASNSNSVTAEADATKLTGNFHTSLTSTTNSHPNGSWYQQVGSNGFINGGAGDHAVAMRQSSNGIIADIAMPTLTSDSSFHLDDLITFDNQSPDMESAYLPTSAFYLQQFEIPGCTDATGACLCGDGCACIGCLTHSGHDGVAVDLLIP